MWIVCPLELAEQRGVARDRANGVREEDLALWREWEPKERAHFEADRPDMWADLLFQFDL
ncbi:MAG TPA: hypothetical protein VN618_07135 [Solirubrobacteraceae bacterium]|nr:hypothetical protein [Solirubrobacteraceae bacterium]